MDMNTSAAEGLRSPFSKVYPAAKLLVLACSALLILGGLSISVGWLAQVKPLLLAFPNSGFATFNTAILLALIGIWLAISLRYSNESGIAALIAIVLVVFPLLVLFEHAAGIDLKIDLMPQHRWVKSSNPVLGMLAPNTALFFIAIGLILAGERWKGFSLKGLPLLFLHIAILVLPLQSLFGYVLDLEWMYRWFGFNRMSLTTAIGALIAAIGVVLATHPKPRFDDARLINTLAISILALVAFVTGITSFAMFKSGMELSIRKNLDAVADAKAVYLEGKLQHGQRLAQTTAADPIFRTILVSRGTIRQEQLTQLQQNLASDALAFGLAFVQLRDKNGQVIAQVGIPSETSDIELPVHTSGSGDSALVWAGTLIYRHVAPIAVEGRQIGSVVIEQELAEVERDFLATGDMGKSGEFALCGWQGDDTIGCMPSRLTFKSTYVPLYSNGVPTFPIGHAMLGQSGHAEGKDSRGVLVLASYRPVGTSGIGLVAKMDSEEIYEPLISRGTWLLLLPVVVLILSAYLIKIILSPIADRLQASEQSARYHAEKVSEALRNLELQQALLRSLTDAMPTLVSYIDRNETYQYCNEHYLHMFGIRFEEIIGKSVKEFFGEEGYAAAKPYLDRAFKGEITWFERQIVAQGEPRILEGRYVPQVDNKGTVTGLYVTAWDATEIRQRERHLSDQASRDSLTGLMNRPALLTSVEREIAEHYTRRDGLALLFLDIDRFKQVNDTYGHAVGDELLVAFANRVRGTVRETDYVARFGGDEFVVLLTLLDSSQAAEQVTKKIILSVTQPIKLSGVDYSISTSVGIAYIHNLSLSAAELLAKADEQLYAAKQAGRDTYRLIDLTL